MKNKDKLRVQRCIENEGFSYCFKHYSDFKDIKDEKFHELRKKYLEARTQLAEYIEYED